eukprot:Protomagalhaensia_wolfi_Nauph_80__1823@NODE_2139_length_1201_cov_31_347676_g1674_i0_p2_GENE_NODE_2139_length_1201_cov_31_347676_g1674_i0NODE_2139_length_1201_cov_31_347676_g1674_i0_p2_ORF_typecomplete_len114_score10_18PIGP/PF08510_12/0_15zfC3HC/PF07967_13/12_NODE_2139_length_1201_cov_31_347676_g1674_i07931134
MRVAVLACGAGFGKVVSAAFGDFVPTQVGCAKYGGKCQKCVRRGCSYCYTTWTCIDTSNKTLVVCDPESWISHENNCPYNIKWWAVMLQLFGFITVVPFICVVAFYYIRLCCF